MVSSPLPFWCCLLLAGCLACSSKGAPAEDTVTEAVAALVKAAVPGSGITEKEQEASQRVLRTGAGALPEVMKLLDHADGDVVALASYTIRDFPAPVDAVYLPALMAAQRPLGADGWLPPAIAKVGTPEAYDFLLGLFLSEPRVQTQLGWALQISGHHLVPYMMAIYRTSAPEASQLSGFCELMKEMKEEESSAFLVPFLELASDESKPEALRVAAVTTAGHIKSAPQQIERFRKIKVAGSAAVTAAAEESLIGFDGSETLQAIIANLTSGAPDSRFLYRLLDLKTAGIEAGPAVLPLLTNANYDLSIPAVAAVKGIGYQPAVPTLIKLLDDDINWQMPLAAAQALAVLKARDAVSALGSLAVNHWYPPVKAIALEAVRMIESERSVSTTEMEKIFAARRDAPEVIDDEKELPRIMAKYLANAAPDIRITRDSSEVRHGSGNRKSDPDPAESGYPMTGYQVDGGLLLGWDRGEFGGGVELFPSQ